MGTGKVLKDPRVFMVVTCVSGDHEVRIETRSKARKTPEVALRYHGNPRVEQQRGRHSDALLPPPVLDEATPIGNDLTSAGGTHVSQDREFSARFAREREHGARPLDHLRGQVRAVFIQNACPTGNNVEPVAAVNVRHRARRA
jgi:hypothetical protein